MAAAKAPSANETFAEVWSRGAYRGELGSEGSRRVLVGNVTIGENHQDFDRVWNWAGLAPELGAKYGLIWNPDPKNANDLFVEFAEDERPGAIGKTRHGGKDFREWLAQAELDGTETTWELRKSWKDQKKKPHDNTATPRTK